MKCNAWLKKFAFYQEIGGKTINYKKEKKGGWKREKADKIYFYNGGHGRDKNCENPSPVSVSDTQLNSAKASESRSYWGQSTIYISEKEMTSTHYVEKNNVKKAEKDFYLNQ